MKVKKVLKDIVIGNLIIWAIAAIFFLGITILLLLFTLDVKNTGFLGWIGIYWNFTCFRIINGIAVIVGFIYCTLPDAEK